MAADKINSPSTSSNLHDCDPSSLAQRWQACGNRESLKNQLFHYWVDRVVEVYGRLPDALDAEAAQEAEETARRVLITPLEWFLGGADPRHVFEALSQLENPPQLCGRIFKSSEPTYSCRDCATDPTCVLCVECFQKSAHRNHRYKMQSSGGGGYCDCGDAEAWRGDIFCDKHSVAAASSNLHEDPLSRLPADMQSRAPMLFSIILNFVQVMLMAEEFETLPESLKPKDREDTYCTMLFNDEIHTYDQVIDSLKKAIACDQQTAYQYASAVDREGRSIVAHGSIRECERVRNSIQKSTGRHGNKSLKVVVMQFSVVALQGFSLCLLSWLGDLATKSEGLRQLICIELMNPCLSDEEGRLTLVEHVMNSDIQLWKVARNQWHQLIMNSMLLDQQYKKKFAVLYTKNYEHIQTDFINDDHDHAVSVTSLSVQIYTVPTLSRLLIVEHDLMKVILKTFNKVSKLVINRDKITNIDRNVLNRTQYILSDLRYIFSVKPDEWTAPLKHKFLEGLELFLEFLGNLQGIDGVVRQTGQHIEIEPEWETAFYLQYRLSPCISQLLDWIKSDRSVLVEAYRRTIICLRKFTRILPHTKESVAGHQASCIVYDVTSQVVSLHLPLIRFYAGVHLLLEKYNLEYQHNLEYNTEGLLPPQNLAPQELMEESLRAQVLISQTHANMWRKNGYSLLNQILSYHSVKFREHMQDKDILLIQIGGSLMDSNDFLIQILHKYNLVFSMNETTSKNPSQMSNEEKQWQVWKVTLLEEFLSLMIVILSERYVDGVGEVTFEDIVKREVIHLLCAGPRSHSELSKALPESENEETGLEEVLDYVATFRQPGLTGTGLYELKPECADSYNPFFYHFNKSDQSKSEETQRKRRKQAKKDEALPPPLPPAFKPSFQPLVHVLECDVFVHILTVIFKQALRSSQRLWSDSMILRALYLVGLALHEEERHHQNQNQSGQSFGFIRKATATSSQPNLLQLLTDLGSNSRRVEEHKDLLAWVIKEFGRVQELVSGGAEAGSPGMASSLGEATGALSQEEEGRRKKAQLAQQRRLKIMEQMSKMQRNFIKENADLFEETDIDVCTEDAIQSGVPVVDYPLVVGHKVSPCRGQSLSPMTCILCQEEQLVSSEGRALVLSGFVQRSTVLSKSRGKHIYNEDGFDPTFPPADFFQGTHASTCGHIMHWDCWRNYYDSVVAKEQRRPIRFRTHPSFDISKREFLCPLCECLGNTLIPLLPPEERQQSPREESISMEDWLKNLGQTVEAVIGKIGADEKSKPAKQQKRKRGKRRRIQILSYGHWDYLESENTLSDLDVSASDSDSDEEIDAFLPRSVAMDTSSSQQIGAAIAAPVSPEILSSTAKQLISSHLQPISDYNYSQLVFSDTVKETMRMFARSTYTVGLNLNPNDDDERLPSVTWLTCAYTVRCAEVTLKEDNKPLFGAFTSRQNDCLGALIQYSAKCSSIFTPDTAKKLAVTLLSGIFQLDPSEAFDLPSILDMDMFGILVQLTCTLPTLYQREGQGSEASRANTPVATGCSSPDLHLLRLLTTAHLVQIMLSLSPDAFIANPAMELGEPASDEAKNILHLYTKVRRLARLNESLTEPQPWLLLDMIRQSSSVFLRCAAIFYHYLTQVDPPVDLQTFGMDEYEPLCKYLGLPGRLDTLFSLGSTSLLESLIETWCTCKNIQIKLYSPLYPSNIVRYPLHNNQLIDLPHDYSQLINEASMFVCPNKCSKENLAPYLCLICGRMLCSQSYCLSTLVDNERVPPYAAHAHSCGASVGIFLRIQECQLLLCYRKRGCHFVPPYLDKYGEPDQGLRRGNPLFLNRERYKRMQRLWVSHGIPEELVHRLESKPDMWLLELQNM